MPERSTLPPHRCTRATSASRAREAPTDRPTGRSRAPSLRQGSALWARLRTDAATAIATTPISTTPMPTCAPPTTATRRAYSIFRPATSCVRSAPTASTRDTIPTSGSAHRRHWPRCGGARASAHGLWPEASATAKNFDRYDWTRGQAMNRHNTDNIGADLTAHLQWDGGTTSLGGDYVYNHIFSTNLGEKLSPPAATTHAPTRAMWATYGSGTPSIGTECRSRHRPVRRSRPTAQARCGTLRCRTVPREDSTSRPEPRSRCACRHSPTSTTRRRHRSTTSIWCPSTP